MIKKEKDKKLNMIYIQITKNHFLNLKVIYKLLIKNKKQMISSLRKALSIMKKFKVVNL